LEKRKGWRPFFLIAKLPNSQVAILSREATMEAEAASMKALEARLCADG
jgi:hypothetical protein